MTVRSGEGAKSIFEKPFWSSTVEKAGCAEEKTPET
jgi:hypothetical protein